MPITAEIVLDETAKRPRKIDLIFLILYYTPYCIIYFHNNLTYSKLFVISRISCDVLSEGLLKNDDNLFDLFGFSVVCIKRI